MDLAEFSEHDLLRLYSDVLEELRSRGVLRSANSPVGDYAEVLVCQALSLQRAAPSKKGYDAEHRDGSRYEIKGRRFTGRSRPSHFSAIRDLPEQHFDWFVGVLFERDFSIRQAFRLPWDVIEEIAAHRSHVNGWIVTFKSCRDNLSRGRDITKKLVKAQSKGISQIGEVQRR